MEVAASIRVPWRCQPRQPVSSKAPSVLAPRSTLPASAASSCPLRDGHRRVQHGARASESADAPAFGATWRPPRLQDAGAPPPPLQFDGRGRAARVSSGGDREASLPRRPRFLCLHGFRTSGEIMRRQVVGRWAPQVTARLDLVFADAPFPAEGASPVAGVLDFDPPYYEWCQFVGEDFLSCRNLDGCFSYLEELMARDGPFDGLLGFSQGAGLSAALAGLQQQGLAFTGVAKVKCVIVIAGAKIRTPVAVARAFDSKITCPSLHFIGDEDFVKVHSEELVQAFADPLVIRHPCGHTVPKLDEKGLQTMLTYLDKIEREIWGHSSTDTEIMGSN